MTFVVANDTFSIKGLKNLGKSMTSTPWRLEIQTARRTFSVSQPVKSERKRNHQNFLCDKFSALRKVAVVSQFTTNCLEQNPAIAAEFVSYPDSNQVQKLNSLKTLAPQFIFYLNKMEYKKTTDFTQIWYT